MKCARCTNRAAKGKRCCKQCLTKSAAYQREQRAEKRAAGVCLWCKEHTEEGYALCKRHHLQSLQRKVAG